MGSRYRKLVLTLGLVLLAYVIARLGRLALDLVLVVRPDWADAGERVGGWLIGLVGVVVVVIPMLKLYGLIDSDRRDKSD